MDDEPISRLSGQLNVILFLIGFPSSVLILLDQLGLIDWFFAVTVGG